MPRRLQVDSLVTLCIDNICVNMESYWYTKCWKHIYSNPRRIFTEAGPFEYLPGYLLNEIRAKLTNNYRVEENIMSLLVTSTLVKLAFPKSFQGGTLIFHLLSHKCQDTLKELTLSDCDLDRNGLTRAIKSLWKLEVLNLDSTYINDGVIAVVGTHCSELRRLSLKYCKDITDVSMKYLFVNESAEDGVHSYGKCKLAESLLIRRTRVGKHGVETVLRNAPNLQYLDHPDVVVVLGRMHVNDLKANAPPVQYKLTSLCAEDDCYLSLAEGSLTRSLSTVTRVCPHVTDVTLKVIWDTEESDFLHPLWRLKNLKNLEIDCYGSEKSGVLFSKVVPVLRVLGQSLTKLHLVGIPKADVEIISVYCPLLEDFRLSILCEDVEEFEEETFSAPATKERSFKFLKFLNVSMGALSYRRRWGVEYCDLTPSQWKEILSSRLLESLTLQCSSSLNDGLLSEVVTAGQQFPNLRILNLALCPVITVRFVQTFLNLPNPLEVISVQDCRRLTKSDFISLKSFCKLNGFDVHMKLLL